MAMPYLECLKIRDRYVAKLKAAVIIRNMIGCKLKIIETPKFQNS